MTGVIRERKTWRTKSPPLYVNAPEVFSLWCRTVDRVVPHEQVRGGMSCSVCGRLVPGAEIAIVYAVSVDYHKQHDLQVPAPLLPGYVETE